MTTNTGKRYERLTQQVFDAILKQQGVTSVEVEHDVIIQGKFMVGDDGTDVEPATAAGAGLDVDLEGPREQGGPRHSCIERHQQIMLALMASEVDEAS
jgi:histidinol phosphatase-like enzyme